MSPASATAIEPEPPAAPTRRASRPIELTGSFDHEGHRLWYTEFGSGEKVVVLTHGIMLTRRMHAPLARRLARAGFRVITLDLLGHGDSDRPTESWRYSMPSWQRFAAASRSARSRGNQRCEPENPSCTTPLPRRG